MHKYKDTILKAVPVILIIIALICFCKYIDTNLLLIAIIALIIAFAVVYHNKRNLENLYSKLNLLLIVIDENGIIKYTNSQVGTFIFPHKNKFSSSNSLIGKNISVFFPEIIDIKSKSKLSKFETYIVRENSKPINVEVHLSTAFYNNENFFILTVNDITDFKNTLTIKTNTLTNAAFKIRTLLAPVRGSLGLLLSGSIDLKSQEALRLLEMGSENCINLVELINDILDIESIENNNSVLNNESFDLFNITKQTINSVKPNADEYWVKLELVSNSDSIMVFNDKARIVQILINLISNAYKFSPKNETVFVHLEKLKDTVKIKVVDRGKGISINDIDKIFDKFYQSGLIPSGKQTGNGLGLSHSKSIVEMLNGTISVESKVGKGTIFSVELPLANK